MKGISFFITICVLSGCAPSLLSQNKALYEQKCLAEGHEKGSLFFSQCIQKLFYRDEDKANAEKFLNAQ